MSAHARRAIAQRQRQQQIQKILSGNNYTMLIMNSAEFVDYIISVKMKQGYSRAQAVDWIDGKLKEHNSRPNQWERYKDELKFGAGLYPLLSDVKALTVLAVALKEQGNVFGKFKIKVYNGSPAIIIDSYPRIREHLTGTRYLASNPKLFTVGVGRLEAAKSMKGGFVVSLIISVTFHALDLILKDEKTWHDFVAGVAVDMTIVATTIAATILVTKVLVGIVGTAVITTAAVPLIIVVVVGAGVTYLSSVFKKEIDEVTSLLSEQLRDLEEEVTNGIVKIIPKNVIYEKNNCDSFYNYFYKITGIPRVGISKSKSNICKF